MKIAIIAPTKHLEELSCYKGNSYHMILAQHILGDLEYRMFYLDKAKDGDFLLLDNGAYEFGQSVDKELLLEAALISQPDLLVLPDKRGDGPKTLELSLEFLKYLGSEVPSHTRIQAVAQGSNKKDWLESFNTFANMPEISVIGISDTDGMFPHAKYDFSRAETLEYLDKHSLVPEGKTVHLCGIGNSGHMELERIRDLTFIEGIDTSAPVVHGLNGIEIKEGERYEKISTMLDFDMEIEADKMTIIKRNIDLFYQTVYGATGSK